MSFFTIKFHIQMTKPS